MVNKAILLALILVSCITTLKANAEVDRHPRPLLTNKLERVRVFPFRIPADQAGCKIIENGGTDRIIVSTRRLLPRGPRSRNSFFPWMRVNEADLKQGRHRLPQQDPKTARRPPRSADELYIATGDITSWADTVDISPTAITHHPKHFATFTRQTSRCASRSAPQRPN